MQQIDVKILDRDYRLAVSNDDRPRLLEAVGIVDERMRAIRDAGRVSSLDRIAVMAALQLAHELLGTNQPPAAATPSPAPSPDIVRKIRRMTEQLDEEIKRQENLF